MNITPKYTVLALIIGSLAPMYAQAKATVSGKVSVGFAYSKDGSKGSTTELVDLGARIWINGSEKLTDNTDFIYGVNSFASTDGPKDWAGFGTDSIYIGARNKHHEARIGYLSSPMHYTGSSVWDGVTPDVDLLMDRYGRRQVGITYQLKDVNGFGLRAHFTPALNIHKNDKNKPDLSKRNGHRLGAQLSYTKDNLSAYYAVDFRNHPAHEGDTHVHKINVDYTKDKLTLSTGLQYAKNVGDSFTWEGNDFGKATVRDAQLTASYDFDPIEVKGSVAYGNSSSGKNYRQAIAGADYKLSKRTYASFSIGATKESNKPRSWAAAVGFTHKLY